VVAITPVVIAFKNLRQHYRLIKSFMFIMELTMPEQFEPKITEEEWKAFLIGQINKDFLLVPLSHITLGFVRNVEKFVSEKLKEKR
jgi:hypothetical protein